MYICTLCVSNQGPIWSLGFYNSVFFLYPERKGSKGDRWSPMAGWDSEILRFWDFEIRPAELFPAVLIFFFFFRFYAFVLAEYTLFIYIVIYVRSTVYGVHMLDVSLLTRGIPSTICHSTEYRLMVLMADPLRTVSEWEPGPNPRGKWGSMGWCGGSRLTRADDLVWHLDPLNLLFGVSGHGMLFYGVPGRSLLIGLDLDSVSNPMCGVHRMYICSYRFLGGSFQSSISISSPRGLVHPGLPTYTPYNNIYFGSVPGYLGLMNYYYCVPRSW